MPSFDHAFDWTRRHVDDGPMPNAVLGVATADGIVALDAFGGASVDDHYALFSITKPLVGLAALRLVEEGRLTPDTPLATAVPEFGAGRDDVVRLRHLVSHTSGIVEPDLQTPAGLRPSLLAPGRDFA
uniref:serine hydrolase domain-containing protein n=1 Tax=Agromyces humi TaxID=1766800 RepID=UPI001358186E